VSAIALKLKDEPTIVLVKQFRPPLQAHAIELPAGLVESGQTKAEAALRELKEETGYSGIILSEGPEIYNTPGLSDEHVTSFVIQVTEHGEQETEPTESIEIIELPLKDLTQQLKSIAETGTRIDAKLWSIAEGLNLAKTIPFA